MTTTFSGDADSATLRTPPHSDQAEQSVLGGLLLDNGALASIDDLVGEDDFYRFEHRLIYGVVASLVNAGKPADVITVLEQLQRLGKADDIGGLVYLNALAQSVPSAANISRYAEIVRERAVLRKLVRASDEIQSAAFNPQGRSVAEILGSATAAINGAAAADGFGALDPLPLPTEQTPGAFPFDALGALLGGAAQEIAANVQAPDSLAAGSVLAAASLASQAQYNVVLPHGQRAPLSLFVVSSAFSGDRKTATDADATRAVSAHLSSQAREYERQKRAFEKAKKSKQSDDLDEPIQQAIKTSNTTIQGLHRILTTQSHIGVFSPEGGELLGGHSMRDDRKMEGLSWFAKAWDGATLDKLRGGEGLSVLSGRRVCLHVMVQPILLRSLLADALAEGQGMLARCLIAQPASLAGSRLFKAADSTAKTEHFNSAVASLLAQTPRTWDGSLELRLSELGMSDRARAVWVAFHDAIERQQAPGQPLAEVRSFASKVAEQAARIAGVIHTLAGNGAAPINKDTIDGAILVASYYLSEHARLKGHSQDSQRLEHLHMLQDWIERRRRVPHRDVLQRSPYAIRNLQAEGIRGLLDELAERNYIRRSGDAWEHRP